MPAEDFPNFPGPIGDTCTFSPLRFVDAGDYSDRLGVCRDRIVNGKPFPEHLEYDGKSGMKWMQHKEGSAVPLITGAQWAVFRNANGLSNE